jgi:uncharacterized membrane protein
LSESPSGADDRHAHTETGGAPIRRLLPVAVILPIVLGALRYLGQRAGLYGTLFGSFLLVAAIVVLAVVFVLYVARVADATEARRRQAELENEAAAPALAERAAALEAANAELAETTERL